MRTNDDVPVPTRTSWSSKEVGLKFFASGWILICIEFREIMASPPPRVGPPSVIFLWTWMILYPSGALSCRSTRGESSWIHVSFRARTSMLSSAIMVCRSADLPTAEWTFRLASNIGVTCCCDTSPGFLSTFPDSSSSMATKILHHEAFNCTFVGLLIFS